MSSQPAAMCSQPAALSSQRSMEVGRGALLDRSLLVLVLPGYKLEVHVPAHILPAQHVTLLALCRWGNALSTKMFVGRDYVLKHIRVKHAEKVEEYKTKVGLHLDHELTCSTAHFY